MTLQQISFFVTAVGTLKLRDMRLTGAKHAAISAYGNVSLDCVSITRNAVGIYPGRSLIVNDSTISDNEGYEEYLAGPTEGVGIHVIKSKR